MQLAECYEKGIGTDKNEEMAKHWYLRSVQLRDSKTHAACAAMSQLYREGRAGFPASGAEAEKWYRRSIELHE
jgi:TPR repeat protein